MPRLSSATPKYRRHKRSGQAVVTLDGRDFYIGPYGTKTSKVEYDRLIGEWIANHRHLPALRAADLTVVELAAAYKRHAAAYYRKDGKPTGTIFRVKATLKLICGMYGETPALRRRLTPGPRDDRENYQRPSPQITPLPYPQRRFPRHQPRSSL